MALTSMWDGQPRARARPAEPVSRLTTPPGRSEVASTSASVIAGSGPVSDATTTTAVLPPHDAPARPPTRGRAATSACGASTADDAGRLGRREVEVGPGHRVGRARRPGRSCRSSRRTRPSGRWRRRPTRRRGLGREALGRRRPRRRTGRGGPPASRPPGRAPGPGCRRWRPTSPANALRAATTASRASLREARAALARNRPSRVGDLVGAARLRAGERAADVELVGLADVEPARRQASAHRAQVGRQAVAAALAAEARLLVAAERARRVEAVERVGPHHAGPQPLGHPQDAASPSRSTRRPTARRACCWPSPRASAGRAERQHRQHRAEDLLAGDAVGLRHAGEDRRREPEAAVGQLAGRLTSARRPRPRRRRDSSRMRSSCSAELMAPMSVFLSSGSPRRSVPSRRFRRPSSVVGDRLLHQQPAAGAADVALVEEDAVDDALDRLVERRVVEHDVGRLAAELERELLAGAGQRPGDLACPTSVEPVKATLSTPGCSTSARPVSPAPVTMLTTPGGRSACRQISANASAVSGVVSAGLSTTVLPHARAGAIFHASMSSGKFHGMTWPATPSGRGSGPRPA